jgi:hypothetical protein
MVNSDGLARTKPCTSGGTLALRSAAQPWLMECRGDVRSVERANIGSGRDDLVNAVNDLVAEHDVDAGEEIVELFDRARAD